MKDQIGYISVDAKTKQRALHVSDSHPRKQLFPPRGIAAVAVTESTDQFTKPGVTKTARDETHGVKLHSQRAQRRDETWCGCGVVCGVIKLLLTLQLRA